MKKKNPFELIIEICDKADKNNVLSEIKVKAKNVLIRQEFAEKYGVELDEYAKLAESDYYNKSSYECIAYFTDGYKCKEGHYGRSISWSEGDKQPVNEWIYEITFSTGAYIFGDDYDGQQTLFQQFFEELRTYKPDYEDLHNNNLYWKIENASKIYKEFNSVLKKYQEINKQELHSRRVAKMKKELAELESVVTPL